VVAGVAVDRRGAARAGAGALEEGGVDGHGRGPAGEVVAGVRGAEEELRRGRRVLLGCGGGGAGGGVAAGPAAAAGAGAVAAAGGLRRGARWRT
jgi:hypothetical protein